MSGAMWSSTGSPSNINSPYSSLRRKPVATLPALYELSDVEGRSWPDVELGPNQTTDVDKTPKPNPSLEDLLAVKTSSILELSSDQKALRLREAAPVARSRAKEGREPRPTESLEALLIATSYQSPKTPYLVNSSLKEFDEIWKATFLPRKRFGDKREDFSSRRERSRILSLLIIALLAVTPVVIITKGAYPKTQLGGNLPYHDCMLSGKITFRGVDLLFGRLQFAQAKFIDLIWNTIVGRGLQAVLLLFAYNVFTKTLMRISEQNPITYELYTALSIYPTSANPIWPLCKAIASRSSFRAKLSFLWLLLSILYISTFPTLVDAVSGYQAVQLTKLQLDNATLIDVSNGIQLASSQRKFSPRTKPSIAVLGGFDWSYFGDSIHFDGNSIGMLYSICTSKDTAQLHYDRTFRGASNPFGIPGPGSPTNVFYNDSSCNQWFLLTENVEYSGLWNTPVWNTHYLGDPNNYQCISLLDQYQWGFSYAFLLIASCINSVWLLGTLLVWLDAERSSELVETGRKTGLGEQFLTSLKQLTEIWDHTRVLILKKRL